MYRSLKQVIIIFVCVVIVLPEMASAGFLQEEWYRLRSRENMKIGNYNAAIEAYEKYLELKPDDREALKGIALAYEKQGQTDKAIARYDKYLGIYQDDAEVAFKQAGFLMWSRYSYRKKDAINYFEMGLKIQDDPQQRLKYAQLLAQDKYDLDRSVEQYEILLKQDAGNKQVRSEYRDILLWDDRYLKKAIEQYEYHVAENPNNVKARKQLAVLLGKSRNRKEEGIAIYAQLVKENPADYGLRHEYARLMASASGYFDQARDQYDILIKKKSGNEVQVELAQLLEQKKATRPEALKLYSGIIEREPGNRDIRKKRASIYMDDKSTAPKALDDYQYIIKQTPTDAGAHQGAAEALAWLERPDDALYHANLARKYSKDDKDATRLHDQLSKGREPRLTTLIEAPSHDGGVNYELTGYRLGLNFSTELTPFVSIVAETGYETYDGETDDESDYWWALRGEYRMSPKEKINIAFENREIRRTADPLTMGLSYTHSEKPPFWSYTLGYEGSVVDDSFLSLVGDELNNIGGATRHELFAYFSQSNDSHMYTFRPAVGWVESASESNNEFINISGTLRFPTSLLSSSKLAYGTDLAVMSYAKDHSGFGVSATEPLSGGYFSPQKFASALLFMDLMVDMDNGAELTVKLGPKFQLVDDASVANESATGFFGSVYYVVKHSDKTYITLKAEYDDIGDRYNSVFLQGQMVFIF